MKSRRLREIGDTPLEGSRWKPIRSELGIRAFGINAYVADAGEQLVAEHVEVGGLAGSQQHEELYVVLSGRATFSGASREIDAPAGTLVFFDDPAEPRAARAEEDETTVLAVGAPVGLPYQVAPWEYWFRARRAHEGGDEAGARAIASECIERYPETARLFSAITGQANAGGAGA
jgi:hypothetical protein